MRVIENVEDRMWHAIEWAFVMGMLAWVLVRLWSDALYDPRRPRRAHAGLRRLWARGRREDPAQPSAGPDDGAVS
jgi:hypothetical protein